jgi:hypothetical protein
VGEMVHHQVRLFSTGRSFEIKSNCLHLSRISGTNGRSEGFNETISTMSF